MRRLHLTFLVIVTSALELVSFSSTAWAVPATKEPFSAMIQITGTLGYERMWTDEEGTMHLRGWIATGLIWGDIVGQIEIIENMNLNSSGYGDVQAHVVITVDGEEAYNGSVDITLTAGVQSGTFVLIGTGGFKGTYITGMIIPTGSEYALITGTKLTTLS